MKPQRIQLSRRKGWKMPPNTVKVTRPGKWGNPFVVNTRVKSGSRSGCEYICVPTLRDAIECYREMLLQRPEWIDEAKRELGGKNLACFCKLGDACHADVLLELANPNELRGMGGK